MKKIPIIRPVFSQAEKDNILSCLESGHVTQGKFTAEFERKFAKRHNSPYAVAVTSCTAALHLALLALGVGLGDEVIVPSFTWVATANMVEFVGATPIFADVSPETFTINPESARRLVSPRTKAIIPVHLFGLCADMSAISTLAKQHGLHIIEDAACALGSSIKGVSAGTMGAIGCFSFHPRKVITTGEGGMLTTADTNIQLRLLALRNHGADPDISTEQPWQMPAFPFCGLNYRMSDLQAAVGCGQMDKVDDILQERSRIASIYSTLLENTQDIVRPQVPEGYMHSWQSYVIMIADKDKEKRNRIMAKMADMGIETRPGTHAVHRLEYFVKKYALSASNNPNAELCEDCSIALPVVHDMSHAQQKYVVSALTV